MNAPSSSNHSRAQLERLIYRRMLIECRFVLKNILLLQQGPQLSDYVFDQIEQVLALDLLDDDQLVQLGVAIHALVKQLPPH